ncbi:MAG: helix-turn-helix domain-containing protein, partial [Bacillota bacterium]|nr:helix-turn-helix domain-containing protein [Bacillota bacterium]
MSGSEFYTARELAQLLKVSESTIWSYTRKGKLPHYKLGKDYRYRLPEVLAALRGLEERSSSGRCTRAG